MYGISVYMRRYGPIEDNDDDDDDDDYHQVFLNWCLRDNRSNEEAVIDLY